jgi:hypothetical protein
LLNTHCEQCGKAILQWLNQASQAFYSAMVLTLLLLRCSLHIREQYPQQQQAGQSSSRFRNKLHQYCHKHEDTKSFRSKQEWTITSSLRHCESFHLFVVPLLLVVLLWRIKRELGGIPCSTASGAAALYFTVNRAFANWSHCHLPSRPPSSPETR